MADTIEVVPYNPEWPNLFESEATLIKKALGNNCIAVHHIGSTAVPGLIAKPIIDILPVVKNILDVSPAVSAMEQLGYEAKGEFGIPFRRFFQKKIGHQRTHNVHVFEEISPEIDRHLKFCDWMRSHAEDREAYGALKAKLALQYPHDIMNYLLGKEAFVANIDAKTGVDGLRIVKALTNREWESARRFRQKYFFDHVPIEDPYTWTFKHDQHVHFILYRVEKIIGYAHIQLWPENRAALRIIVVDEPHRNEGAGSELLKLCERCLLHQGTKTLQAQSSPEAYKFYCDHEYIQMPFNDPDGYIDPEGIDIGKDLR